MKKYIISTLAIIIVISLSLPIACAGPQPQASDTINVIVTIQPQLEFVKRIGADKVTTSAMIPPGASPHTYEPLPSQMTDLANADIYAAVGSGIEFELAWLDKLTATNDKMLLVDCSTGIDLIETSGEHEHEHDNAEGHHHGAFDPHIWLSPANTIIMAQNIMGGLVMVDQQNSSYYEDNYLVYKQELMALDTFIRDSLQNVNNRAFLTYHPAFAYFARDYGLKMLAIEEEGKEPSAADITRIIQTARENNIKIVFISPQFNPQSARTIAEEIGANTVEMNVLAENYLENMQYFVALLVNSLN
jgi:zinc transport system substrate-binding protein